LPQQFRTFSNLHVPIIKQRTLIIFSNFAENTSRIEYQAIMAGRNMFSPYNLRGNVFGQYPDSRSYRHRGLNSQPRGYQYDPYSLYYNDYICDDCHDRQYFMTGAVQYYSPHDMICDDPCCSQFDIVMYDPGYGGYGGSYTGGRYAPLFRDSLLLQESNPDLQGTAILAIGTAVAEED
jgi:hypothetical protein